jgi:PBP1b-binding outer membrane lipoprotein LpoB
MRLLLIIMLLTGCGSGKTIEQEPLRPQPTPTTTPVPEDPPTGDDISFQKMQAHMVNYCQGCHASAAFMTGGETALKQSQVKSQLWSKRMPPANAPKALPENIRTEMISWF